MATLQQTLRGLPKADTQTMRGPGGVLQQKKTLQEATQGAGLQTAPLTPMAAQGIGASPDAAKMSGTPQQVKAALEQASLPVQPVDLQTAVRRKQYTRATTAEEMGSITKSAAMQSLGGLGDRVTNMVKAEYQKPVGADVDFSADIDIIRNDPKSQEAMDAMLRIAQSGQSLDKVAEMIPEAAAAIAEIAKNAIRNPNDVKAEEFLPSLGYDAISLAGLLGITPEEVQGYSLSDLQNKVNQVISQEFTQAQQIDKQAVSPLSGTAERGLAREVGRELSTTGVRASEADMQRLSDEVSTANRVSFLGQTKSVTDWLADDEISAMIKEVVESPADSSIRKQMQEESPDLYNFITRNETSLKEAASGLDTSTSQFKQIQETNKKIVSDSFGNIALDPKLQEELLPGSTKPSATAIKPESSVLLAHLQNKTTEERGRFATEISSIVSKNPSAAKEFALLTPEQLANLNIENNGKRLRSYKNILEDGIAAVNLEPDETVSLLALYSPALFSADQLNKDIETQTTMSNLGFADSSYTTGTLPIRDGRVDVVNLKDTFIKNNPPPKILDAANGTIVGGEFNYKTPIMPKGDTPQGRVLQDWGDFGKSGTTPSVVAITQRLDELLSGNRKIITGTGGGGWVTPFDQFIAKQEAINDLKTSGTWSKWGYTDVDNKTVNPNPLDSIMFDTSKPLGDIKIPMIKFKIGSPTYG